MQKLNQKRSAVWLMFKKGKIEIEVFMVLITMVFTSAIILLLVYSGTITVKEDVSAEPVLNTEFLPVGREGFLAVKEFSFCSYVDENLDCLSAQQQFSALENVYVRFVVESSTFDNQVLLLRNYRIMNPSGNVVLEAEHKNVYNFEATSTKDTEETVFADFFVMGAEAMPGEYTLDVIMENPLLGKKVIVTKRFMIVEGLLG